MNEINWNGISDMIHRMAVRVSRFATDDRVQIIADLEMAGWCRYLEIMQTSDLAPHWLQIKSSMRDELSMWQRGIKYPNHKSKVKTYYFCDGCEDLTPEKVLLADEQFKEEIISRDASLRPNAMKLRTHCPSGHPYSGDNLRLYKGTRKCKTCSRERKSPERSPEKNRHWYRLRTDEQRLRYNAAKRERERRRKAKILACEIETIKVLNLELQREVANAVKYQRIAGSDFGTDSKAERGKG